MQPSIPRRIHQTWKTETIPKQWRSFAASWQTLHPDWAYQLWTDEANREFVATCYPELLKTFDGYSYAIQRADAVRYCILHHFGGVYADLDIECLQPLDELLERDECVLVLEPAEQGTWLGKPFLVSNALMASRPGHPFLQAIIETLIADSSSGLTHRDVLETTGPAMLQRVLSAYRHDGVTVLPSGVAFPFVANSPELRLLAEGGDEANRTRAELVGRGAFAVHYWANSWVTGLAGELVNPEPHNVPGYVFYPGLDSPGNDIANLGRDIRAVAQGCDRMAGGVAFNTDGFVKGALLPVEQWLSIPNDGGNEGLYVKSHWRGERRFVKPVAWLSRLKAGLRR